MVRLGLWLCYLNVDIMIVVVWRKGGEVKFRALVKMFDF
jgi:hypothetical protein